MILDVSSKGLALRDPLFSEWFAIAPYTGKTHLETLRDVSDIYFSIRDGPSNMCVDVFEERKVGGIFTTNCKTFF